MTTTPAFTSEWWDEFVTELNRDERWRAAARWFDARIQFTVGDEAAALEIRHGKALAAFTGLPARGADIVLEAPREQWDEIVGGTSDWFKATSPGLGTLAIGGDVVTAMRNAKTMWLTLEAMKRTARTLPVAPEPSPEPRASGKETVGRYLTVAGVRTYYEEAGEGLPIVCLHAASQDTMMYRHVLDGLSDEYRVISIDAPGHAKSLLPPGGPFTDISQHAEFNEEFMAALGLSRPAIIGCSFAGNQVLELAARRPGAYSAIVSSEGADYTPTVSDFFLDMMRTDGHQIVDAWSQSLTGDRTPDDRRREVVWQIQRNPAEVMVADLIGYGHFDERAEMHRITDPVLLLRGDADWLVSQEQVEATQSRIAGSTIAVLAGTGHYPMIENPFEYNETVREFLHSVGYR
ncbi:alpha/beta fold hydrolase [Microbacterium insulae]|uniref:Alpha/beta fold hydrolase n=1 Tax=Microbacterium insulae TaxID=483014 RepID=A0ABW3AFE3_9MICO